MASLGSNPIARQVAKGIFALRTALPRLCFTLFNGYAIRLARSLPRRLFSRWVLRCILSLVVALSLIDATLPRLLAFVLAPDWTICGFDAFNPSGVIANHIAAGILGILGGHSLSTCLYEWVTWKPFWRHRLLPWHGQLE